MDNEDKDELDIDKNQLDIEWEKQPTLMRDWCITLADATLAMDRAKDRMALVEADLDQAIRLQPDKYGIGKLTEKAIEQAISSSLEREKAADAYYKSKHVVGVAQAMVNALEHRKRALTCLVDLHQSGYFASKAPSRGRARGVRNEDE